MLQKKAVLLRERMAEYEKSVFDAEYIFQKENPVIKQVELKICQTEQEISRLKDVLPKQNEQFTELFHHGYGTTLTDELAETFIQKIIVYDEQHIEIKWKFDLENAVI